MGPGRALARLLLLLGVLGGAAGGPHSLRNFYIAVSEPSPGVPQFVSVGYVDGNVIIRYDSETGRAVPGADWMAANLDQAYWDSNTQIGQGHQQLYRVNLETLRSRYNQSGGVHTVQVMYGCDLLEDGSTRGYSQYAYDGRDFIALDMDTMTFTAADAGAQITKRKWEEDGTVAEQWKQYLNNTCIEWLRKYVSYGRAVLERKGTRRRSGAASRPTATAPTTPGPPSRPARGSRTSTGAAWSTPACPSPASTRGRRSPTCGPSCGGWPLPSSWPSLASVDSSYGSGSRGRRRRATAWRQAPTVGLAARAQGSPPERWTRGRRVAGCGPCPGRGWRQRGAGGGRGLPAERACPAAPAQPRCGAGSSSHFLFADWIILAPLGILCKPLAPLGAPRTPLIPLASHWKSLEPLGNLPITLDTLGTFWIPFDPFQTTWHPLELLGTVWIPLEKLQILRGSSCNPLELPGTLGSP